MRNAFMTNWMQDVDDMFRGFSPALKAAPAQGKWFSPAVDIQETEKEYFFHFDLPGMSEKDLTVNLTGRELHVTGERKMETEAKDSRRHRSERFFGQFERSFVLPEDVNADKIEANFKDGVLEIRIAKLEAAQPKTIPVRTH